MSEVLAEFSDLMVSYTFARPDLWIRICPCHIQHKTNEITNMEYTLTTGGDRWQHTRKVIKEKMILQFPQIKYHSFTSLLPLYTTIHLHHSTPHLSPKLYCVQATENEECVGTQKQ
jgi:hypothetical protein